MHTMTELMKMNDKDLSKVAQLLSNSGLHKVDSGTLIFVSQLTGESYIVEPISYCSDIHAVYELEESIPDRMKEKYTNTMGAILGECRAVGENPTSPQFVFAMVHAPARIRCIAYILTLENAPKNEA